MTRYRVFLGVNIKKPNYDIQNNEEMEKTKKFRKKIIIQEIFLLFSSID